MSIDAPNRSLEKMTSSTDTVLGLSVCQKWIRQPEIWHAIRPVMVLQHILRFFESFENFGFCKKLCKKSVFRFGGVNQHFFGGEISHLKGVLILRRLSVFFICILLEVKRGPCNRQVRL